MRDFFKGWKRKVGVVTLVMACAFAAVWVRSQENLDEIAPFGRRSQLVFGSMDGRIWLAYSNTPDAGGLSE